MNEYLKKSIEQAEKTYKKNAGGPFGAVIVNKDGEIISIASNHVLEKHDPTAHAEIEAIRMACKNLKTHDLSECTIYSSCEPCPMCLSAIIWANIKKCVYGANRVDAENVGFRDNAIYEFLKTRDENILELENIDRKECLKMFEEYQKMNGKIY